MRLIVDSILRVEGCPPDLAARLVAAATCPNPAYTAALRQGRSVRRLAPETTLARREGDALLLPRGLAGIASTEARRRGLPPLWTGHRLLHQSHRPLLHGGDPGRSNRSRTMRRTYCDG